MIRRMPWSRVPSEPLIGELTDIRWATEELVKPAANTAALMLYIALNLMTMARRPDLLSPYEGTAEATYDELAQATGLSRTLIAAGLDRLKTWRFVVATGSDQKRKYQIVYGNDKYIRVPCRAIVDANGAIRPFQSFRLRSKIELHALKIYLYLASIRGNLTGYAMVTYETIHARTGVAERDIHKATSFLITTQLLQGVNREHSALTRQNEPNKYFLTGFADLFDRTA